MPPEANDTLQVLQQHFAKALRGDGDSRAVVEVLHESDTVSITDRVGVYQNNARHFFRAALGLIYPVLRLRVGEEFFRRLAHEFRLAHPSRRGDLHWVGAEFPAWLQTRLVATEYAWLADLARLEWACEEAMAAPALPALSLESLVAFAPDAREHAALQLQPSLRLVESPYPVASVWQANQGEQQGPPVNLDGGAEHCACACTGDRVVVYRLDGGDYAVLRQLALGRTFAAAVDECGGDPAALARALEFLFTEGLVVGFSPSAPASR